MARKKPPTTDLGDFIGVPTDESDAIQTKPRQVETPPKLKTETPPKQDTEMASAQEERRTITSMTSIARLNLKPKQRKDLPRQTYFVDYNRHQRLKILASANNLAVSDIVRRGIDLAFELYEREGHFGIDDE